MYHEIYNRVSRDEALTGGSSLSDDVLVVLGVHADLLERGVVDEGAGLLVQGGVGLLHLIGGTLNLDLVALVQKLDVDL